MVNPVGDADLRCLLVKEKIEIPIITITKNIAENLRMIHSIVKKFGMWVLNSVSLPSPALSGSGSTGLLSGSNNKPPHDRVMIDLSSC